MAVAGGEHLRVEQDHRGVAVATIDVAGMPVNVITEGLVRELGELVQQWERDAPRAIVFRSGKSSGFLAGADVRQIQRLRTVEEVQAVLRAGQELFQRLERLPCPVIAAIHGPCLGGGLEFALACHYRIARDDPSTRLGLPEVQLGLIPGWGGTQRLPRLVGWKRAVTMILEGASLPARKAWEAGLVDAIAEPAQWEAAVERFVTERLQGVALPRPRKSLTDRLLDGTWAGRWLIFSQARKRLGVRAEHYPALTAALRALEAGLRGRRVDGFAVERQEFARVVFTPAARRLLELFFAREKARKTATWVGSDVPIRTFQKVAVIGGGVMGSGIAQLLAVNGYTVVVKEVQAELAAAAQQRIAELLRTAVAKEVLRPADAQAAMQRLTVTTDWEPLQGADLAVEAVVEKEEVKRTVFQELARHLGPQAILASNTSALSISRLAEAVPEPGRVAGLHFFNPVHKMPLVEVIRTLHTQPETIAALVELVRKLGKVPVVVADSPGFLVNRILFPYLDEAVRLLLEGVPAEAIDRAAVRFGMPMGPLELLDQVGIDIAADVSKTFAALAVEPSPTPQHFAAMVADGALGKKTGRGFYQYEGDKRKGLTSWARPSVGTATTLVEEPSVGDTELSELQQRLIYPMLNEAARCLDSGVVPEAWMVDLAMVLGTGFAPFRGGPLHTADALGIPRLVRELDVLQRRCGPRYTPAPLLRTLAAEERDFYPADDRSAVAMPTPATGSASPHP
ncbi:MAG: 3-hydroxyacyl-CoA dehydrogenase NAD-binding domain-containing protein [Gemmataceae bacterium]|nr:3-hydroxyacyl-CoA dehydrogenase NAD-binding domain-containing protein [Gemmataceae bacterium]